MVCNQNVNFPPLSGVCPGWGGFLLGGGSMKSWWAPVRSGLILDPKHRKKIGKVLWLLTYFFMYANRGTGKLNRKVKTIADEMNLPVRTVESWLTILRRGGYIKTRKLSQGLFIEVLNWRPLKGAGVPAENCVKGKVEPAKSCGAIRKILRGDPQNPAGYLENYGNLSGGKNYPNEDCPAENCGTKESLLKESLKRTPLNPPRGGIDSYDPEAEKELEAQELWLKCLKIIEAKVIPEKFNTWFVPVFPITLRRDRVVIGVPTRMHAMCLERNYNSEIREALMESGGFDSPPVPEFQIMSAL